jgi:hypothetical protein
MITEFVVDRMERSFDNSFSTSGGSVGIAVATLPSIDEFVREEPGHGEPERPDEFVQRTSRSPHGTYEARHEVSGAPGSPPPGPAAAGLEPDLLPVESHIPVVGAEAAIVNEVVEPAEAWVASAPEESAAELETVQELASETAPSAATSQEAGGTAEPEAEPAAQPAPEVWVAEERDAFDWHGVASLAVPPAEEQRAAEEWSSTEWERSGGSVQDHVAGLLAQVSRRIRSGELEVQGSKQMGTEAALVAALGALLAESKK